MKFILDKNQRRHLGGIIGLFFSERPGLLWLGMAIAAVTALSSIALLGISGWFITATAVAGLTAATALAFDVFVPAAAIRLFAILRTASRYGERLITHDATLSILAALREKLFRGWAEPGAARALLARPAALLFRLTVDTDALDSLYLRILVPVAAALSAAIVCGLILTAYVSPLLGIGLTLWLILIGLGAPVVASSAASNIARRRAYGLEALRARTVDLVSGQTELAITGRLAAQCEAMTKADSYLAKADDAFNRIETATAAAFAVASSIALTATLLTVGALVEAKAISAPVAALALLIALSSMDPFTGLRRGALELGRTVLAARRLAPRLRPAPPAPKYPPPDDGSALALSDITAGYDAGAPLFKNLSLTIQPGECVALVGASGAGKSTLLNIVTGELPLSTGRLCAIPHTLLPQKTELFRDSIRENLLLAAPQASDERLWEVLEAAGLDAAIRALPAQLDTLLGEGGLGLSGGQARRLALARMLLRDTPLWLFDEPTEGLDTATAKDVLDRLKVLASGKTVLMATHIRREALLANRILVMRDGAVARDLHETDAGFEEEIRRLKDS